MEGSSEEAALWGLDAFVETAMVAVRGARRAHLDCCSLSIHGGCAGMEIS